MECKNNHLDESPFIAVIFPNWKKSATLLIKYQYVLSSLK